MEVIINQLKTSVAQNEIDKALLRLQGIFSLADSELSNDVILLSARFSKLKSNIRRGILSQEEIELMENKINHSILSLINEIEIAPSRFEKFNQVEVQIQTDTREKTNIALPEYLQDALVQRMTYTKQKELSINCLWIDDNPTMQKLEKELLQTIGVNIEEATTSEEAREKIKTTKYAFIISDINRQNDSTAGITFMNEIVVEGHHPPFVFYAAAVDYSMGTPAYAFGITNLVTELLHFAMDIIERKY